LALRTHAPPLTSIHKFARFGTGGAAPLSVTVACAAERPEAAAKLATTATTTANSIDLLTRRPFET
jgi:hypothetical protein